MTHKTITVGVEPASAVCQSGIVLLSARLRPHRGVLDCAGRAENGTTTTTCRFAAKRRRRFQLASGTRGFAGDGEEGGVGDWNNSVDGSPCEQLRFPPQSKTRSPRSWRQFAFGLCGLLCLLGTAVTATAQETNGSARPSRLSYESFRIIAQRNIFNPNRSSRGDRTPAVSSRREPDRRVRTESFALVGTLSYEKGTFAFFDGSSSQYQKALQPADTIAGYKIADIASSHVTLESTNSQTIQLPVGMEMKRQDEGEWLLTARAEAPASPGTPSSSGAAAGGDAGEILKRLMQKREQEATGEQVDTTIAPPVPDEKTDTTNTPAKPEPTPAGGADDILKRLMQKREQELNK
jgi:hypothetical protein